MSELNILGKDYLDKKEAAHYCCVSIRQLDRYSSKLGIAPFTFMGKLVYRKADLQRVIEGEAQKQWQALTTTDFRSI